MGEVWAHGRELDLDIHSWGQDGMPPSQVSLRAEKLKEEIGF